MRRKSLVLIFCLCIIAFVSSTLATWPQSEHGTLSSQQAIALLRSKTNGKGSAAFRLLKEVRPSPESTRVGEAALEESKSSKIALFGNGVLASSLRFGGFLVLEYDSATGKAAVLHLVSLREDGQELIESEKIEGTLEEKEAAEIVQVTESLMNDLLRLPMPEMRRVIDRYFRGRAPSYKNSEEATFFTVPSRVRALGGIKEVGDLGILFWSRFLRQGRWALARKAYAANPSVALRQADDELTKQIDHFLGTEGLTWDNYHANNDMESIRTRGELAGRIRFLERLNAYLDRVELSHEEKSTFDANAMISTFPVQISVTRTGHRVVVTPLGFIAYWRRLPGGGLVLDAVSQASE